MPKLFKHVQQIWLKPFPNYAKLPLVSGRKLPGDWCYPSRPIHRWKGLATAHPSHTHLRWVVLLCCYLHLRSGLYAGSGVQGNWGIYPTAPKLQLHYYTSNNIYTVGALNELGFLLTFFFYLLTFFLVSLRVLESIVVSCD